MLTAWLSSGQGVGDIHNIYSFTGTNTDSKIQLDLQIESEWYYGGKLDISIRVHSSPDSLRDIKTILHHYLTTNPYS